MAKVGCDFLGYVRVKVNRKNALCSAVEVYLDQFEHFGATGEPAAPLGTIGCLYLRGRDFVFVGCGMTAREFVLPVSECL